MSFNRKLFDALHPQPGRRRKYLVIGFYDDHPNSDRWADSFMATSPQEAERMALMQYPGITVVGVITGRSLKVVA